MTALSAHHPTTSVDRILLHAAAALNRHVTARVERRARRTGSPQTQDAAADARATAVALGSVGIIPR